MIKEVIVVEGKDDISKVKAAVDAEVISTHGFGYGMKLINILKSINKRCGIIIFTDPDYMGNKIRKDIQNHIPNAKHAFLPQNKANKNGNIGVENASLEDIRYAIDKARATDVCKQNTFTKSDIISFGLSGGANAKKKREEVSKILNIGYGNSNQFLNRLNNFNITREEFLKAIEEVENGKTI